MNSDKTQRQEQQLYEQWFQELQDKLFREYAQQQQQEELARLNGKKGLNLIAWLARGRSQS